MTEALWLTETRPAPLLDFVREGVSKRKVVLFNCACCRRVWSHLGEEDRTAVVRCEAIADDPQLLEAECARHRPPPPRLQIVHTTSPNGTPGFACVPVFEPGEPSSETCLREHLDVTRERGISSLAFEAVELIALRKGDAEELVVSRESDVRSLAETYREMRATRQWEVMDAQLNIVRRVEEQSQADLVRDIFGNPFRATEFATEWRTGTVLGLAREMYTSRDFSAMPVLADALQDAGCDNETVLAHCRGAGPHVLGCWVVDGLLEKT